MKIGGKLAGIGIRIIKIIAVLIAVGLVSYGAYAIWDTQHIERNAYSSFELTQYRPTEASEMSFEEIKAINEDTTAWLILYDTNIDYPVMQGKDNLEYASKDAFGRSVPSGSIYLAAEVPADYSADYNLVFGHHMDNGAMFGNLEEYLEESFLESHKKGALITPDKLYDVEIITAVATNAYDDYIYDYDKSAASFQSFAEHLMSLRHSGNPMGITNADKIIAFSTCSYFSTNARTVVFAKLTENTTGILDTGDKPVKKGPLWKHRSDYWALLNLICMIFTIYILIPIHRLRIKYLRANRMKKLNKGIEELREELNPNPIEENPPDTEDAWADIEDDEDVENLYHTKRFRRRSTVGTILEIITAIVAVIAFILTEDIRLPMIFCDEWTWLMVLLLCVCWIFDRFLLRYKPSREKEEEESEEIEESV